MSRRGGKRQSPLGARHAADGPLGQFPPGAVGGPQRASYADMVGRLKTVRAAVSQFGDARTTVMELVGMCERLLVDIDNLGQEFALMSESDKTATLTIQLANVQMEEMRRRLKAAAHANDTLAAQLSRANHVPSSEIHAKGSPQDVARAVEAFVDRAVLAMSGQSHAIPIIADLHKHVHAMGDLQFQVAGHRAVFEVHNAQAWVVEDNQRLDFYKWCRERATRMARNILLSDSGREDNAPLLLPSTPAKAAVVMPPLVLPLPSDQPELAGNFNSFIGVDDELEERGEEGLLQEEMEEMRNRIMLEHAQDVKKVSSALHDERERQQQRLREQLANKRKANTRLSHEVQVQTLQNERDAALERVSELEETVARQAKELQALRRRLAQ